MLPGKLLPVVAVHPLYVPRRMALSANTQQRGSQGTITRWGPSRPRIPLEQPICELPRGRLKNPSQYLLLIGGGHSHQIPSPINPITKPSRCRETPRVTRLPQSQSSPSATNRISNAKCTRFPVFPQSPLKCKSTAQMERRGRKSP